MQKEFGYNRFGVCCNANCNNEAYYHAKSKIFEQSCIPVRVEIRNRSFEKFVTATKI